MKRTPKLIAAAAAIALTTNFSALPAHSSAWKDAQTPALEGVKKVTVILLSGGDGVNRLGFDENKAQQDIVSQLEKAGISIEPYGSIREKLDTAALQIETHLTVIQSTDGKPLGLTYAIDGYILDPVVSVRRKMNTPVLGIVWKSKGEHGYVSARSLPQFTEKIEQVVKEFIKDWKKANPSIAAAQDAGGNVGAQQTDAIAKQQEMIKQQQEIIAQQQAELKKLLAQQQQKKPAGNTNPQ